MSFFFFYYDKVYLEVRYVLFIVSVKRGKGREGDERITIERKKKGGVKGRMRRDDDEA